MEEQLHIAEIADEKYIMCILVGGGFLPGKTPSRSVMCKG